MSFAHDKLKLVGHQTDLLLVSEAALRQDQDFFDGDPDWDFLPDFKNPWHGKPLPHALISMIDERARVVRQQYTSFTCCPREYLRIVNVPEPRVLLAPNVEVRMAPQHAAQDPVVEVLVGGKLNHD